MDVKPHEQEAVARLLEKLRAAEARRERAQLDRERKERDRKLIANANQGAKDAVLNYWRKVRSDNHPDKGGDAAVLALYKHAGDRIDALKGR